MPAPALLNMFAAHSAAAASGPPVAGYIGWWDASALSNGAVATWADQSGNGYDLVQGTSGNRPSVGSNTQNGLPTVTFDGSDDYLQCTTATNLSLSAFTVFCVVSEASSTNYAGIVAVHAAAGSDYNSTAAFVLSKGGGTGTLILSSNADANASGVSGCNVLTGLKDATTSTLYVNGSSAGTTGCTSSGTADGGIVVGARYLSGGVNTSYALSGYVCEIILYDTTLGSTDRASVESYLQAKWATP